MKTTALAINKVCSVLEPGLIVPVFKYTKPTLKNSSEYVVVNSLPINADVMQNCVVNVNYHVKDYAEGIPDIEKLEAGTNLVIGLLDGIIDQQSVETDILIDLERQETIREEALKYHYSNIRFMVRIINKL